MRKGSVYKRCNCLATYGTSGGRLACKKPHGSWVYVADAGVNPVTGRRRQIRKGGFRTHDEAQAALDDLATSDGQVRHDEGQTVAVYLSHWITDKERNGMRPTTLRSYRHYIDDYLAPTLGRLRLRELRPGHVEDLLRELPAKGLGPASVRRVHATLRSAMSTAKRRRLIAYNPAVDIDLPSAPRPRVRPWEPEDLGRFLDLAASDPMGALFELIAATGLRRGEACGLRWDDIDLDRGRLVVRQQLVSLTGTEASCPYCAGHHRGAVFGLPKTASGEERMVDLDGGVIGVLMAHKLHQDAERARWGAAFVEHGLVFAREDGTPIPPERVTRRFIRLVATSGLRPIRLHDLRHGQASLMLAAGVPMAVVSKRLGHSTITLTSDTYSHLLEGVGRDAAERAAALIPRTSRAGAEDRCDHSVTTEDPKGPEDVPTDARDPGTWAPPSGLEPETLRLTVECSAN